MTTTKGTAERGWSRQKKIYPKNKTYIWQKRTRAQEKRKKMAEMVKPYIYVNVKYNIRELLFTIPSTSSSSSSRFAFLFKRFKREYRNFVPRVVPHAFVRALRMSLGYARTQWTTFIWVQKCIRESRVELSNGGTFECHRHLQRANSLSFSLPPIFWWYEANGIKRNKKENSNRLDEKWKCNQLGALSLGWCRLDLDG